MFWESSPAEFSEEKRVEMNSLFDMRVEYLTRMFEEFRSGLKSSAKESAVTAVLDLEHMAGGLWVDEPPKDYWVEMSPGSVIKKGSRCRRVYLCPYHVCEWTCSGDWIADEEHEDGTWKVFVYSRHS